MTILVMVGFLAALLLSIRFSNKVIDRLARAESVSPYRSKYVAKTVSIGLVIFYAILIFTYLGIEYSQISFFLSSVFAVLGVALFAQWSILSNITASLIIFFAFPYRVGDRIRICDKDDDISGVIVEISLFHVLVKRRGDLITYPNSLILQKAVVKLADSSSTDKAINNDSTL